MPISLNPIIQFCTTQVTILHCITHSKLHPKHSFFFCFWMNKFGKMRFFLVLIDKSGGIWFLSIMGWEKKLLKFVGLFETLVLSLFTQSQKKSLFYRRRKQSWCSGRGIFSPFFVAFIRDWSLPIIRLQTLHFIAFVLRFHKVKSVSVPILIFFSCLVTSYSSL